MSNTTPPNTGGGGSYGNSPSDNRDKSEHPVDSRSSSSSSTRYADIHPLTASNEKQGPKSGFSHEDDEQVTSLARQMSHRYSMTSERSGGIELQDNGSPNMQRTATGRSVNSIATVNPFYGDKEELNPDSEKFNSRSWVKNLVRSTPKIEGLDHSARTAGVAFTDLSVHGFGSAMDYQKDVSNIWLQIADMGRGLLGAKRQNKIQILRDFDGLVRSGEMLVVLGRPGSGCSTLLKTIAGETHGVYVDPKAEINYQGIPNDIMHKNFRGEVIYQAETDVHFPQLTVGQTLDFAARARTPRTRIEGVTREQYADHMRAVFMAIFGLSHTVNTPVGNDFIRGVSGGERKRVSIAEVVLAGAPLQCWDNSTRGLDSATAVEFVKSLRMGTEIQGNAALLAIYQAPQAAYDYFDKAVVLYEGRQIYFGPTTAAKEYFTNMGFVCRDRSTTADFLTSLTSPAERIISPGFEDRVPRTADEFAERWRNSDARKQLLAEIDEFNKEFPVGGQQVERFTQHRQAQQAKSMRAGSPYTISLPMQVQLCMRRGFQRLRNDFTLMISAAIGNFALALIIGSVFYNLPHDTSSFFSRGALLFFAILMNAFASALEILTLYAQRPIVEKHAKYSFYHPFAEAVSSMLVDLPAKMFTSVAFNLTLYFMTNLRREVGPFFVFLLFSFFCTLVMSNIFRTIAAFSRTLYQAMPPAAIFILALVTYTGFAIPTRDMRVYMRWINYVNPIAYAFEALMVNEFRGQEYPCVEFIPNIMGGETYANIGPDEQVCTTVGSVPGRATVSGSEFILKSYQYTNLWRNLGILAAFFVFFLFTYLAGTEYISAAKSKGEVLVFRKGKLPPSLANGNDNDVEAPGAKQAGVITPKSEKSDNAAIHKQTAIFHWEDVCYDVQIKDETRRILDHVDGWVKPGTLTALMGVSGAGKTTLLDVLANRVTMGVVSGNMCVDGHQRDESFQRKTGYVQQQDLHLSTTTVREALQFSALLRQPAHVSKADKLAYADEVIDLLEMSEYADAVVGVPGEGLNVEQRKRLTIGVELAAKPQLLLFLDEPTSGLDSQTAWSICALMRKLANNGQAILCTIHQPSAILFQEFDRLLFLAKGGKTVYFGPIGTNSHTLTSYFERNGSHPCPPDANPAEWMLEVIGAAPGAITDKNWFEIWSNSPEKAAVKAELVELERELSKKAPEVTTEVGSGEFAVPFTQQLSTVTRRVFEQYWRTPTYIYSKFFLCVASGLFIGFSFFMAKNNQQGLQNQMFSIFMLLTIFGNLAQQMMPHFVTQRALYEVRERPSKAYSWKAFMLANIFVEIPWQTLMAALTFFSWYYPIGLYRNAIPTDAVAERGGLMFLLILVFYLWISTFSHMLIAAIEVAETGGNIGNLLFSLALIFCGVLAPPGTFPQFWIFVYRLSPFTYLVSAMLSTGVAGTDVVCSDIELLHFNPPANQTCGEYMEKFMTAMGGGAVINEDATENCSYCTMTSTDQFLQAVSINFSDRWRNFGILTVYIVFNIAGALFLYWLVRVPKKNTKKEKKE